MNSPTIIKTFVLLLALWLPGAACNRASNIEEMGARGATISEIKNRYREPYMRLRMRFAEIARVLPPVGSVRNTVGDAPRGRAPLANLDPLPTAENTGFAAAEQLLDPGRVPPFDFFHLDTVGCPVQCFQWLAREQSTATANAESRTEDREGRMARAFEAGLAQRYLVVYRAARYARPQVSVPESAGATGLSNFRYTPGSIELEVFTVDLQSNTVVDSFRVSGVTPPQVRFSAVGNSSPPEMERSLLAQVEQELRSSVRASVFAGLTERTGRTFNPPGNPIS